MSGFACTVRVPLFDQKLLRKPEKAWRALQRSRAHSVFLSHEHHKSGGMPPVMGWGIHAATQDQQLGAQPQLEGTDLDYAQGAWSLNDAKIENMVFKII